MAGRGLPLASQHADLKGAAYVDETARTQCPPKLVIGGGELVLWAALLEVFPTSTTQRRRVHKIGNVLDKMPKIVHGRAKKKSAQGIYTAHTTNSNATAFDDFISVYWANYSKVTGSLSVWHRTETHL